MLRRPSGEWVPAPPQKRWEHRQFADEIVGLRPQSRGTTCLFAETSPRIRSCAGLSNMNPLPFFCVLGPAGSFACSMLRKRYHGNWIAACYMLWTARIHLCLRFCLCWKLLFYSSSRLGCFLGPQCLPVTRKPIRGMQTWCSTVPHHVFRKYVWSSHIAEYGWVNRVRFPIVVS